VAALVIGRLLGSVRMLRAPMRRLLALLLFVFGGPLAAMSFLNPVLPVAPDPAILVDGGRYLATWTSGDRIVLRAARTLGGLASANDVVVLRSDGSGPAAHDWWAPELHRLDGRWWLYWCATTADGDDASRRVFVSGCVGDDPLTGAWEPPRQLALPIAGYAIDPTVFTVGARRYLAWSAKLPSESGAWQHICLARLNSPTSVVAPGAVVCAPDRPWERHEQPTTEGPAALVAADGTVHLMYSASAFWSDEYCLGMLTAAAGADLLDPRSWRKHPEPVLASSAEAGAYGPGHHAFFRSPDGLEDWVVFHARGEPAIGHGPERRAARAQRIAWADSRPVLGSPASLRDRLPEPSGWSDGADGAAGVLAAGAQRAGAVGAGATAVISILATGD
jgi:GH43 family beta-xylosidase